MRIQFEHGVKYIIGLVIVVLIRLIPHPPNIEPIMATLMPLSKRWGWLSGMLFSLVAILGYDVLSGTLGSWSLVTSLTYAALGIAAGIYLKNRTSSARHYVAFAIFGTLFYDAVTGVGMSTLLWHTPFMVALLGQIPFTVNHLLGNIVLAAVLSPALYRLVITNPALETSAVLARFRFGTR